MTPMNADDMRRLRAHFPLAASVLDAAEKVTHCNEKTIRAIQQNRPPRTIEQAEFEENDAVEKLAKLYKQLKELP